MKLVYFGFDTRSEQEGRRYEVQFGISDLTITDRRGEVLYSGGQGVLDLPHGNPDGSGVNICKLTGSDRGAGCASALIPNNF